MKKTFDEAKTVVTFIRLRPALRNDPKISNLTTFVPVRWYYALGMLRSLYKNRDAIIQLCSEHFKPVDKDVQEIIDHSLFWLETSNIIRTLHPINDLIRIAEKDTCKLSDFFYYLLKTGAKMYNASLYSDSFKLFLERYNELDLKLLISTYSLDPRYNCKYLTEDALKFAKNSFVLYAKQKRYKESELKEMMKELADYRSLSYTIDNEVDSLKWWFTKSESPLRKMAISLLAIKASSSNVERLFSFLKWTHSARRNRLSVDTLESLAILKYYFAQTSFAQSRKSKFIGLDLDRLDEIFEPFRDVIDIENLAEEIKQGPEAPRFHSTEKLNSSR